MKKHFIPLFMMILVMVAVAGAPAFAEDVTPAAPAGGLIDLTGIGVTLLTVIGSIIALKVKPWVLAWLEANTSASQQKALNIAARTLVFAAEQIYRNEQSSGNKKMEHVKTGLQKKGFDIDIDAIEAAVKEMHLEEAFGIGVAEGTEVTETVEVEVEEDEDGPGDPDNPDT